MAIDNDLEKIANSRRISSETEWAHGRIPKPRDELRDGVKWRRCYECGDWKEREKNFYLKFKPKFPEIKPHYQSRCIECDKKSGKKKSRPLAAYDRGAK